MARMRECLVCERRYRRSKGRAFGKYVCSDRCLWAHFEVPVDVIYERDSAICHLCGYFVPRNEASRDHVKPRSKGGRSKMLNLKLAHNSCNSRRGSMTVEDFQKKLEAQLFPGKRAIGLSAM